MRNKPNWSFYSRSIDEIDLQRVLNETPNETNWVCISDRHGKPVVLFMRQAFLDRFEYGDSLNVAGDLLGPSWGVDYFPHLDHIRGSLLAIPCGGFKYRRISDGWRSAAVNQNGCKVTIEDLELLKNVKEYARRIPVRVYLG
jgi:hypothetical protein